MKARSMEDMAKALRALERAMNLVYEQESRDRVYQKITTAINHLQRIERRETG